MERLLLRALGNDPLSRYGAAMNIPAPASPIGEPGEYDSQRPYQEYALDDLVEMLEHQYDQQQPLNERMVFELAHRAVEAERAGVVSRP